MHLNQTIESLLGNSEEASVYLANLNLGDATVTDIAKKAGVPRTSCYHILARLTKKGLINFYRKKRRIYYVAENPHKFFIRLREQEAALKEALPQLQALRATRGAKPSVSFYEEKNGITIILNTILEQQYPPLALLSIDDLADVMEDEIFKFIEKSKNKHLRMLILTNNTEAAQKLKRSDAKELRITRFLPEHINLKTATFIYGGNVAMIAPNQQKPMGIIIEDVNIAETQRLLFQTLWDHVAI
jgi:HTH-type transcriptional regulator, sugar sensing transcriptional regulator